MENMKWLEELFGVKVTDINQFIVKIGTNLIMAVLILVIGFWLAKVLAKTMRRILRTSHVDEGLITFSAWLLKCW
jgi:glycopeptide antibiotics resistance protein